MDETHVRLRCSECGKAWQTAPTELPSPDRTFHCPTCQTGRRLSEYLRSEHDLRTLQQLG